MKIYLKEIEENEMTRSKEKRKKITKIIVCPILSKFPIEYIENLKYQDEKYLSYNYIIEQNGNIVNIIPEEEVAYSTSCFDINFESISIAICIQSKKDKINDKEEEGLINLLKYLINKYNLKVKEDIFLLYNLLCTREFEYYIDNYFEFKDILINLPKNKRKLL